MLPLLAVVVIANAGLSDVAHALASLNPITHKVEVHDPNGNIIAELQATTVWPVAGIVTLEFGEPNPPYQARHTGIDIANPDGNIGDPVTTFMAGRVTRVIHDKEHGNSVVIDHGHTITSQYLHLSATNVLANQAVAPGDIIGLEGSTGHSTGPHVHFEIRVSGIPIDPRTFMIGNPPIGPTR